MSVWGWNDTKRVSLMLLIAGVLTSAPPSQAQNANKPDRRTAHDLWPSPDWPTASPAEVGLDAVKLNSAREYALSAEGSGMILRHGKVVLRWGDQAQRYDIKSATKSFGTVALGLAIQDVKIELEAPARRYHPTLGVPPESNKETGWLDEITILHLATHTAGFEKRGGYEKLLFKPGTHWHYSDGGPNWLAECITLQYKQDLDELMFERVFTPLGITREDLRWRRNQYRPHEIDGRRGRFVQNAERADDGAPPESGGPTEQTVVDGIPRREFGAGIHANVEALSRIGYLHLREGRWKDEQILTKEFVKLAVSPIPSIAGRQGRFVQNAERTDDGSQPESSGPAKRTVLNVPDWDAETHAGAADHYGLLWWTNADGALEDVPRDAYWAWGLHDSLIVVIPSLDLVVVRGGARGKSWPRKSDWAHYDVLKPFLEPIVAAAETSPATSRSTQPPAEFRNVSFSEAKPPYPPSPVITGIEWAPKEEIIRLARGSDNWPLTWAGNAGSLGATAPLESDSRSGSSERTPRGADDGHLYTAYGDGWGFEPRVEKKLSLGLARVEGHPPDIKGINIRSPIEEEGDGRRGRKACGMLMVDGTLYMFLRNADRRGKQSQLAWSKDHGRTWTEADWRFETLGYPTFLNFGRNDAGARDEFAYLVSHDDPSAYEPADRFILMRVPKDRITDREAYEFFVKLDERDSPVWMQEFDERGAGEAGPPGATAALESESRSGSSERTPRGAVFEHPGRCYRSGISYNAGLKRYIWCQILPADNAEFAGRRGDVRFEGGFGIYDAPEPWGPWTTVYFTEKWDVGPGETSSFPPKWMSRDGTTMWLVFSGDDYFSVRRAKLRISE